MQHDCCQLNPDWPPVIVLSLVVFGISHSLHPCFPFVEHPCALSCPRCSRPSPTPPRSSSAAGAARHLPPCRPTPPPSHRSGRQGSMCRSGRDRDQGVKSFSLMTSKLSLSLFACLSPAPATPPSTRSSRSVASLSALHLPGLKRFSVRVLAFFASPPISASAPRPILAAAPLSLPTFSPLPPSPTSCWRRTAPHPGPWVYPPSSWREAGTAQRAAGGQASTCSRPALRPAGCLATS